MNPRTFDLLTVRLFLAASHLGSFTKAAQALNLVPSAVSRRLAELEDTMGITLFVRSPSGATLTASGLEVERQFTNLLASHEKVWATLDDLSGGARGTVRVWATSTSLTHEFSEGLNRFLDSNSAIRVEVEERTDAQVVQAIQSANADVGFCSSHQNTTGLNTQRFCADRIALVAPAGHPLARRRSVGFADIAQHDLVGWDEGVALGSLMQSMAASSNLPLRTRVRVRSLGALCSMVKAGVGVAVAPHPRVLAEARMFQLRTIPINEPWSHRDIHIICREPGALSPCARLFLEAMARTASEAPGEADFSRPGGTGDSGGSP